MTPGFTVLDAPQRSPAWLQARVGRLTGSRAADMLATVRYGESVSRGTLRRQIALEIVTGRSHEARFVSDDMRTGIDREPAAAACYEARTEQRLIHTGFLASTTVRAGASLDGHVGDFEGLAELKCPRDTTHWRYLHSPTIPGRHRAQILHALWLTGAAWCDWVSYHQGFPPRWQARILRVERDERAIAAYDRAVTTFLTEVDRDVDACLGRRTVAA